MKSEYYLMIEEQAKESDYNLPIVSHKDAYYWANRIIDLGSKGVSIWQNNGNFVDMILAKSKKVK